MNNDDFFDTNEPQSEQEIAFFVALCELDDLKKDRRLAQLQGRGPYEHDKLYKKIEKLEKKVKRDGAKLDGIKQKRVRSLNPTTRMVKDYLTAHPGGAALAQKLDEFDRDIPNIYKWARMYIDKDSPSDSYDIAGVEWGKGIRLHKGKGIVTISHKTLENQISIIKKNRKETK